MKSTVRFDTPDRFVYVYGPGWVAKVEYRVGYWNAVELNEWGGFRARLYDGRG